MLQSLTNDSYNIQDYEIPLFEESEHACSHEALDRSAENLQSIKSASNSDMYENNNQIETEQLPGCDVDKGISPNETDAGKDHEEVRTNPLIDTNAVEQPATVNENENEMESTSTDSENLTHDEPQISKSVTAYILFREYIFN